MDNYIYNRVIAEARYLVEMGSTVRATAKAFGVSKSTVHKDVTDRLRTYKPDLYKQVAIVLKKNKDER